MGYSQVWMEKLQVLDSHAFALLAKQLAVLACDPDPGGGDIQIANAAFGPAVSTTSFLTAAMTDGSIPFVGLRCYM